MALGKAQSDIRSQVAQQSSVSEPAPEHTGKMLMQSLLLPHVDAGMT